jgi:hypothetical protein
MEDSWRIHRKIGAVESATPRVLLTIPVWTFATLATALR